MRCGAHHPPLPPRPPLRPAPVRPVRSERYTARVDLPPEPMALLSSQARALLATPPPSSSSWPPSAPFPAHSSRPSACSVSSPRHPVGRRFLTGPRKEGAATSLLLPRSSSSSASTSSTGPGAELLGDVAIYSALTGEPVLFRDLWDQNVGIVVVALLRHFGCPCCWELASVLRDAKPRFDSAGVKLIAVGVGTPDKARILAERMCFNHVVA